MARAFTSQHQQALKSAGCPDNVAQQLQQSGCDPDECCDVAKKGSINWQALLQAVQQFGPQIVAAILGIFGSQVQSGGTHTTQVQGQHGAGAPKTNP